MFALIDESGLGDIGFLPSVGESGSVDVVGGDAPAMTRVADCRSGVGDLSAKTTIGWLDSTIGDDHFAVENDRIVSTRHGHSSSVVQDASRR